jgi:hypothetical protein
MTKQKPEVLVKTSNREISTHPAFGVVIINQSHCSSDHALFGSDIGHHGFMTIEIREAELHRDHSSDSIIPTDRIIKIELSHAQYVQAITSQGNGGGIPCTIDYKRTGEIERCPSIDRVESKHEIHRREIKEYAAKACRTALNEIAQLEELINSGKTSKKALSDALRGLKATIGNLPSNMEFTVSQAEETYDKIVSDSKIEVESFVATTAARLGWERLSELTKIGSNK